MNRRNAHDLRVHAEWYRTLANATSDSLTREILTQAATEFDAEAKVAEPASEATALVASAAPNGGFV